MNSSKIRIPLIAAAALLLLAASERAGATFPTDVLLGQPAIASSNWGFLGTVTPGLGYANPGASISFDLGSVSGKSYFVNGFGIAGEVISPGRSNWSTVKLEFSDSPTFASETITNILLTPLVTTGVMETNAWSDIFVGRYVRITDTAATPAFTAVYQLSLFGEAVPEPSSLALLGLGGLLVWRRLRQSRAA